MTTLIADDASAIASRIREIAFQEAWREGGTCPKCERGTIEARETQLQCNECKAGWATE
jgi:hypothetical protein